MLPLAQRCHSLCLPKRDVIIGHINTEYVLSLLTLHFPSPTFIPMPNESKFTPDQDAFIQSYYASFERALVDNTEKAWKKENVANIMASPLFLDLPQEGEPNGASRAGWTEVRTSSFVVRILLTVIYSA